MPVKPSFKNVGHSRGVPGKRNVSQRNSGKYSLHDAGFVASVLKDYKERVNITDGIGKILLSKSVSQSSFVQEWAKRTGEEQFSSQHLRKWLAKGAVTANPGETAVQLIERQRMEAFLFFSSLKRDILSASSGRNTPFGQVEKVLFDWVVNQRLQGM